MSNYKDSGEKSNESTSEVSASFTCQDCAKTFNSRQELKEYNTQLAKRKVVTTRRLPNSRLLVKHRTLN